MDKCAERWTLCSFRFFSSFNIFMNTTRNNLRHFLIYFLIQSSSFINFNCDFVTSSIYGSLKVSLDLLTWSVAALRDKKFFLIGFLQLFKLLSHAYSTLKFWFTLIIIWQEHNRNSVLWKGSLETREKVQWKGSLVTRESAVKR